MSALMQLGAALEGVDERRTATEVEPLRLLLTLGACGVDEFGGYFDALCAVCPEVSSAVAEAVLNKRSGMSKADAKELLNHAAARGSTRPSAPSGASNAGEEAWEPEALAALWGAPYGQAVARLEGSKKSLFSKARMLIKVSGSLAQG